MLKDMTRGQLESVIDASNSDSQLRSGSIKGYLDARGLIASDLMMNRPTSEVFLECEDAINEALEWEPLDFEDVMVGSYGAEKLAELIGGDVWTHGNLWREDRVLTHFVCRWFAAYVESYIAELRRLRTELAGALPS